MACAACGTRRSSSPYRGTFAFSETMLVSRCWSAPIYWITADPVLTYNVAFI